MPGCSGAIVTKLSLFLITAMLLLAFAVPCTYAQSRSTPSPKIEEKTALEAGDIAGILSQSLVLIETQDKNGRRMARGSGFFLDQHTIITNLHIFEWAHTATVKVIKDGARVNVKKILVLDRQHDVCTFRVDYDGIPVKTASRKPRAGDRVYNMGNPLGLEATFSSGMVTAIRASAIQIDAPISPGSSGGPVANDHGEIIGISTFTRAGGQNLNFAVPLDNISQTSDNLPVEAAGRIALSDIQYDHLSGPVKSVKLWESKYTRGNKSPERLVSVTQYDESGFLSEYCTYDETGRSSCTIWERGDDTFVKLQRTRQADQASESIPYKHSDALTLEYLHHPAGGDVKAGGEIDQHVEVFDSYGDLLEVRDRGVTKVRKVYSDPGVETEQIRLESGKVTYRIHSDYTFDEVGNWTTREQKSMWDGDPNQQWKSYMQERRDIEYW